MEVIKAPDVPPAPFGVTSVATSFPMSRALQGYEYLTHCNIELETLDGPCDGDGVYDKTDTSSLESVVAHRFVLQAQTSCSAVANPDDSSLDLLNRGEAHGLEQFIASLTPTADLGTVTGARLLIARLVHTYAQATGSLPVLHISAGAVQMIGGISRHGNHLETVAGSKVSAGTGYPDLMRITATGPVTFGRGQAIEHTVTTPQDNHVTKLSERPYALDLGCGPILTGEFEPASGGGGADLDFIDNGNGTITIEGA